MKRIWWLLLVVTAGCETRTVTRVRAHVDTIYVFTGDDGSVCRSNVYAIVGDKVYCDWSSHTTSGRR